MSQSDTIELTLAEMVHGGNALGRHQGRPIFVPYAIPGERIRARIVDDRGRFAFAQGVTLLTPSPARVRPICPHFGPGRCGGCAFQHIAYEAQPRFKRDVVIDQLKRLGGFRNPVVHPTIPSPEAWAYRSHTTFQVDEDGRLCYIGTDGRSLIPIEECHIIRPELVELFEELAFDQIPELDRVRLQVGSDGAGMVILSTKDDEAPALEVDLPVSINFLLSDNEPANLIGSSHTDYLLHGRRFRVTAGAFFHPNIPQTERMVDLVMERLNLTGGEAALDLYAGVGTFTAFMAQRAALVTSIESYPPAVSDADENLAEFDNIDLLEGSVESIVPELDERYDAAVVDPPPSGMDGRALDALAEIAPRTLVYVSADPAALARDGKRLAQKGYRLVDVQPLDMAPQTYQIQAVAHFTR